MAYLKQRHQGAAAGCRTTPRRRPAADRAMSVFVSCPLTYFLSARQELGYGVSQEHGQADFCVHADDEYDITANGRPFPERRSLPIDTHEGRKGPDSRKDDEPHEGESIDI